MDLKQQLQNARKKLHDCFDPHCDVYQLQREFVDTIDQCLQTVWQDKIGDENTLTLLALGSYGRQALAPHSDIDLLIISEQTPDKSHGKKIESFLQTLWDMGLQPSHTVHTMDSCLGQAKEDVELITNLGQARVLLGDIETLTTLKNGISQNHMWPHSTFFEKKIQERNKRYEKFDNSAYNVEPNVKNSPGGLRDYQLLLWLAQRFPNENLIKTEEAAELKQSLAWLTRVRFGLHCLTNRCEDRLLFTHQVKLAPRFGFAGKSVNEAVEQFMQRYYQTIHQLRAMNSLLLQQFREKMTGQGTVPSNYLDIDNPENLMGHPKALFKLFLSLAKDKSLLGLTARTIRALRSAAETLSSEQWQTPDCRPLFLEILTHSNAYVALRLMNRFGLLGHYLPVFQRIVGRMQYDLFHSYTVDQHTLFVLRNVHQLIDDPVYPNLSNRTAICIAAIFHDIAKGREGDHSTLGKLDAEKFCQQHAIDKQTTSLICWLVEQHLLLSTTAQRRDIDDPIVIKRFVTKVKSLKRLKHLYLLTIADVRATNPNLWNSWRQSLFAKLYDRAKTLLADKDNQQQRCDIVEYRCQQARSHLQTQGVDSQAITQLWATFDDTYFLHENAQSISELTAAILATDNWPLIRVSHQPEQGTSTAVIYTPYFDGLFTRQATALANAHLSIAEARITNTNTGYSLNTFLFHNAIDKPTNAEQVKHLLHTAITSQKPPALTAFWLPQRLRVLEHPCDISFQQNKTDNTTEMTLIAADRPGLLAQVGIALQNHGVRLHTARIATLGERAEDVFVITDTENRPVKPPKLQKALIQTINQLLSAR